MTLLGLERQRTRIAMDLHDELGSGIGSIGILSGLLACDTLDGAERRGTAAEIAETAEELGGALSDIVWSLDRRTATLDVLGTRLAEAGSRLFSGDGVEFEAALPAEPPSAPLPLAIRRNVLLIGLEALHNAARHAAAHHVTLALVPRGRWWELSVRDDGVGLDNGGGTRNGGVGRRGMRLRATEIGAELRWSTAPGSGTAVTLRFALRPPRLAAWRERLARRRRGARRVA